MTTLIKRFSKPPVALDAVARREWKRMTKDLIAAGLLEGIDHAALTMYCAAYSDWCKARRQIEKRGLIEYSRNGNAYKSPHVDIAEKAAEQMRKFLVEFGCTPASNLAAAKKAKKLPSPTPASSKAVAAIAASTAANAKLSKETIRALEQIVIDLKRMLSGGADEPQT